MSKQVGRRTLLTLVPLTILLTACSQEPEKKSKTLTEVSQDIVTILVEKSAATKDNTAKAIATLQTNLSLSDKNAVLGSAEGVKAIISASESTASELKQAFYGANPIAGFVEEAGLDSKQSAIVHRFLGLTSMSAVREQAKLLRVRITSETVANSSLHLDKVKLDTNKSNNITLPLPDKLPNILPMKEVPGGWAIDGLEYYRKVKEALNVQ